MAMIGKVLRMRHREKKSVREIVKATSLARNTVRKYLRLGKAEAPKYRRPEVPGKLAPFVEAVQQALLADARRPKKERRTAKALHAQLAEAGYEGGYSRLTDYIRAWRAERGGVQAGDAYVPLSFELGEAFQFDWSEEPLVIGGVYQRRSGWWPTPARATRCCSMPTPVRSRRWAALPGGASTTT
jgi:transposase